MKKLIAIVTIAAFAACGTEDKPAEEIQKDQPLTQSANNPAFNTSFAELLSDYYHVKDALVLSNDTLAIKATTRLVTQADKFDLSNFKADTNITDMAKGYLQTIVAEGKALAGEANIEGKRKSFQMISDSFYDLIRTVRYDQAVVYHQFCPMAFNDDGAYWLSQTRDIKNPYFGKKMLSCGEVKDSLNFSAQ